jgi:hypothetical protein
VGRRRRYQHSLLSWLAQSFGAASRNPVTGLRDWCRPCPQGVLAGAIVRLLGRGFVASCLVAVGQSATAGTGGGAAGGWAGRRRLEGWFQVALPCGRAWSACPHSWRALTLTGWAGCGLCQVGGPLDKFAASGGGVNLFRLPMTPYRGGNPNGSWISTAAGVRSRRGAGLRRRAGFGAG